MNQLAFLIIAFTVLTSASSIFSKQNRIIGGLNATQGQFPFFASLRSHDNEHFCGGTVISCRFIITAAHCSFNKEPNDFFVVVGSILRLGRHDKYLISKIVNHPRFDPHSIKNDISLVSTLNSIVFYANVNKIALSNDYVDGGFEAVLVGFGFTNIEGPLADYLQWLTTTTLTNLKCNSGLDNTSTTLYNHQICTLAWSGKGFARADSGGPLIVDNELIGIISWRSNDNIGISPDVYTRVSSFRSWIDQQLS